MNLQEICKNTLNNADLDIDLDRDFGLLKLFFTVSPDLKPIIFYCEDCWRIHIAKDPEDSDCIFVGETEVTILEKEASIRKEIMKDGWQSLGETEIKPVVKISIEGGAMISILCEKFRWEFYDGSIETVL